MLHPTWLWQHYERRLERRAAAAPCAEQTETETSNRSYHSTEDTERAHLGDADRELCPVNNAMPDGLHIVIDDHRDAACGRRKERRN